METDDPVQGVKPLNVPTTERRQSFHVARKRQHRSEEQASGFSVMTSKKLRSPVPSLSGMLRSSGASHSSDRSDEAIDPEEFRATGSTLGPIASQNKGTENSGYISARVTELAFFRSVAGYTAFPGVETFSFVHEARTSPLEDMGGFQMGRPVRVDIPNSQFTDISLTVGPQGVLAWVDKSNKSLHVFNILNGSYAVVNGLQQWAFIAICDDYLAYAEWNNVIMRRAKISDIFKGITLEMFEKWDVPHINSPVARVDMAPHTGNVLYMSRKSTIIDVNIRDKTYTEHTIRGNFIYIASTTGIMLDGVKCLCGSGYPDYVVQTLNDNNLLLPLGNLKGPITFVLPSASNPQDLTAALFLDSFKNMYYRGQNIAAPRIFQPCIWQSLVRLCSDVFLFYDDALRCWMCIRICVP